MILPQITVLKPKRLQNAHPWVFSNEIRMTSREKTEVPGALVQLIDESGKYLATAHFNPHSLIAGRVLSRDPKETIDQDFYKRKLQRAHALRRNFFPEDYYRLIHAEGDALPGLIIDRFGDVFSLQTNTAGMDRQIDAIKNALIDLFNPRAILAHNDSGARTLEGLENYTKIIHGNLPGAVSVRENNVTFQIDLLEGQKTGWFYDHRANRAFVAQLARDKTMLDGYCYAGSFAIQAACVGAKHITALDRSEQAIQSATTSAKLNKVDSLCTFRKTDVFDALEQYAVEKKNFDVVVMDPPAFIKSKKDHAAGLKGYQKLARMASLVTAPQGFLFIASCSHHAKSPEFFDSVTAGIRQAGRNARLIRTHGADTDHPVHPQLPESEYLKSFTFQLD